MSLQTFIFIHDQEILLEYIRVKKFQNLKNLKFVFLGNGNTDKIENLENVIISKNLCMTFICFLLLICKIIL